MSPEPTPAMAAEGRFARALLDPDAAVPAGVTRSDGGAVADAFAVYRNNVVAGLAEAIRAAYPVTMHLLGPEGGRAMAVAFGRAHPPRSPVMALYGDGFAEFLARNPATARLPLAAAMARLERARLEAYHAADAPVLDGPGLAARPPEILMAARLVPHPAARLVFSVLPVATVHGIEQADMAGEPQHAARAALALDGAQTVLVTRPAFKVLQTVLAAGAGAFLDACLRGDGFAVAAEAGFDADPAFDLQAALSACLAAGAFTAFAAP